MMFSENGGRPGDERGFVHKSFIGKFVGKAVKTLIPAVGVAQEVVSTGRSFFRGGRARTTVPRALTARVTETSTAQKRLGADLKFPGFAGPRPPPRRLHGDAGAFHQFPLQVTRPEGPCPIPNTFPGPDGVCRPAGDAAQFGFGVGQAVMGQYGAALQPGSRMIDRAVCLRGMQLGNDGLCYNKSQITNKQRMWPAGRRPLLSGGDMRAISIASRAGRRMELATKRLQRMGMMKKASPRRLAPHQHARASLPVVSVP